MEQPTPQTNANPAICQLLINDILERNNLGVKRYGTPLQAENGRDTLLDLEQELLDAVYYMKTIREELRIVKEDLESIRQQTSMDFDEYLYEMLNDVLSKPLWKYV